MIPLSQRKAKGTCDATTRAAAADVAGAPQVKGATIYHSLLLVPTTSSATTMADLRDAVFAFTDPTVFSGRIYPTALVRDLGFEPGAFFTRTFFTYSHDNAIYAVADGLADAAAVDSLVYEFAVTRNPWLAERVRVIHRSPPFGRSGPHQ